MSSYKKLAVVGIAALISASAGAAAIKSKYLKPHEPAKHALVIGNEIYATLERIESARTDAQVMAANLEALGYKVLKVENLQSVDALLNDVLPKFEPRIAPGDIVVLYFSGHGFGHGPYNYLAPAAIPKVVRSDQLEKQAIAIEQLETALRNNSPGMLLFLIDACRSLSGFVIDAAAPANVTDGVVEPSLATAPVKVVPKGMGTQRAPPSTSNIITVYAAAPGTLAYGKNDSAEMSIFTKSLANRMLQEDVEVRSIFDEVTADVRLASEETQEPTVYRSTAADLFLKTIPEPTREAQRKAWMYTLDSNLRERVQWFSYRFAVSLHAAAARQWLEDQDELAERVPFTQADPIAVERAWGQRTAISLPTGGLAFPRSTNASQELAILTDKEIGLVVPGLPPAPATTDKLVQEVEHMIARKSSVTVRDYVARAAPSTEAKVVQQLPFGTRIRIKGIEKRSAGGVWVSAETREGGEPMFVKLEPRPSPTKPIELGQSLEEILVPQDASFPYLVEEGHIKAALDKLAKEGKKVTWVSVSARASEDKEESEDLQARVVHANYLLKQAGIEGKRITSVPQAEDVAGDSVRLRFFGIHNK